MGGNRRRKRKEEHFNLIGWSNLIGRTKIAT